MRQSIAAFRLVLVFTVLFGLMYPLALVGIARIPGLASRADGSFVRRDGRVVGSALIGQSFIDAHGNPLPQYFQSRPSAAGKGYDPTSTSASNLGPQDVVDSAHTQSLLTQVCSRSKAVGALEGVDGRRPFCTPGGVGAVLGVFRRDGLQGPPTRVVSLNEPCPAKPFVAAFEGVPVECARPGEDYSHAVVTPVRGDAPATPVVPPDAVTASGSGLDPHISPAYAALQAPRVARERHTTVENVEALIAKNTTGRALGFLGQPVVNVVQLNLDLDQRYPSGG
jgi:K+-transporting ATPase ATPase C chain